MNEEKQQQDLGQTKKCSRCSELVQKSAKKCKHCGSDLRNWFIRHKIISVVLILFIVIVGSEGDTDNEKNLVDNNQYKTEKSNPLSNIDYKIVEENDVSYALANRFDVRVVVKNNLVTENQIKAISEKIVNDYKTKGADAISILYYFDENQIDGSYTLAMAEWAPNGDWGQADLKKDQILTYKFTDEINKDRGSNIINNTSNEIIKEINEKTYQEVFKFSGNGAKKSEPFIITGDRFKIKYDCNGTICQAFLKSTKNEYDLELIMNSTDPIKDETIIYGAGEYYIDANIIGSYTMIVEDYR